MKKNIKICVLILIVVIISLIFLWPLSFSDAIADDTDLMVVLTYVGLDENGAADITMTNYKFQPDSEAFIQIRQILSKYSYHRSLRSFFNNTSMDGGNYDYWLHLFSISRGKQIIYGGTSEINVNDHIYNIGYWGNKAGLSMMNEIRSVLETQQPISTT